ncbi:hypothetical protein GOP47_0024272 [Adiantum capillus-veneris]|uniref:Protein transport protein SEC23 n=1 Tax=Adiantum capillus-veneris TaxID=13818 RepID=A0A9D4U677_ADICA|nr:hypothetical protein GOP47_0024272 [Adiantum capillus-veneris]
MSQPQGSPLPTSYAPVARHYSSSAGGSEGTEIPLSNGASWASVTPDHQHQSVLPTPLSGSASSNRAMHNFAPVNTPPPPPNFRSASQIGITSPPLGFSTSSAAFSEIPVLHSDPPVLMNGVPSQHDGSLALSSDDSTNWSAASSFVLFTAHAVLKEKKAFNIPSLGFGAIVCPGREVVPIPPSIRRSPCRCQNCGAFSNLYCSIAPSTGQWKCPFCDKMNSSSGTYKAASKENLENWPELVTSVVDYVEVSSGRPGFVPVSETILAAPLMVLIDENLDDAHLQHLQSSLHGLLDSLPLSTRIGLITYGRTVSLYDFSQTGVAAADVFPGNSLPNKELQKTLLYGTGVYLAPLHVCISVAHSIVSSLRPYRGDLVEDARYRCMGTAVEIALSLIQGPSMEMPRSMVKKSGGCSRVLVCVGGPNTLGQGSVPHSQSHPSYMYLEKKAIKQMEHLGQEARRQDAVVDILCAGTCPVRVPVVQPLAAASGGVFILHDDFGESFGLNLQRAAKRTSGFRGIFEARSSDCFSATHVIGPGKAATSSAHETARNDKSVCMEVPTFEECQSFVMSFELNKDIKGDNVYFQFIAQYTNPYLMNVTRVVTVRLATTNSLVSYVRSIDDEVAAVLIGKRTVAFAKTASDALDMRASIDERTKQIAIKLGKPLNKSKLRCFPSELPKLGEILFHLRRGPLLGNIVGHEDERVVLRNLFLQASFDLSLRMLSPRVLMHREGGTFEELPAYDLAMQSNAAIVLDHGTDIFIWMGSDLSADETHSAAALAACRTLVEELTDQRFPAPRVLTFKEGTSQARYLQSRLIPAHKDPPYEQEARFPQLRSLNPDQRARLKSKFFHVDDLSFCEWMRSLKLVPAEPH